MTQPQRYIGLDLARVTALFLVILQHSWSIPGFDAQAGLAHSLYSGFVEMNVPLFIAISGFFQIGHEMPPVQYYRNRMSRLLIPFLIWSVPVFIISLATGRYGIRTNVADAVIYYFSYLFTGRINTAYWFVYLIFGMYAVTPVLHAVVRYQTKLLTYSLPLWVLSAIFAGFPIRFSYLGYYVAGYVLVSRLKQCGRLNAVLPVSALLFTAVMAADIILKQNGHGRIECMVILKTVSLLSMLFSVRMLPCFLVSFLERVSNWSYMIYLTHFVPVAAICTVFPHVLEGRQAAPLAIAAIVLALECAVCRAMAGMRFLPHRHLGLIVPNKI